MFFTLQKLFIHQSVVNFDHRIIGVLVVHKWHRKDDKVAEHARILYDQRDTAADLRTRNIGQHVIATLNNHIRFRKEMCWRKLLPPDQSLDL